MIYNKLKEHGNNLSEIDPKLLIEECYDKMNTQVDKNRLRDIINERHRDDFIEAHRKK